VAQPAAGTAPYEYSLDGTTWQSSNLFSGLAAGLYTVFYRESNGCQGSLTITINEPPVLAATSSSTPVLCNGQSNGIITVSSNGGVTPYEYSLDGGLNWQSGNTFTVPAGPYTVTIRDANNCTTTTSGNVTEPAPLVASALTTNASCNGGNDGTITVSSTGGNATTAFSLDGVNFQPSNIFNVGPGNYIVTVKDNQNCTATVPVVVGLTNDLTFTPQADPTICEGTSTQLELVSNGLQYSWTPATGLSSTTIANPVANPTVTTQYIVTATLGRCSADDTVIVNVNPAPIPDAGPDGFICYGQTYQLQGSGGTQFSWSPSTYLDDAQSQNPVSSATRDMVYTLSIASDANGCASLVTDDMRLDVTPPIKVSTYPFDTVAYAGDQFQLLAVPSDPDVINYTWTPATGLSDPTIANPIVTTGAVGDVVQYQVTTSTVAGCLGLGYVTVKVYKGPDIYVPTAFTPNNDGLNDRLIPIPVGIKTMKLFRIFNRWGQLIFSTTRLHEGWDGKINGVLQPTGTYVWMVEVVTNEDKVITKKGTLTLIR
jgi:gliding motility-associated-like protein